MGAIAGITFGLMFTISQTIGDCFPLLKWPNFLWFMLFAYIYGGILTLLVCSLEIAPRRMSFDPFPNQQGVFKLLSIVGLIGTLLFALIGYWDLIPFEAEIMIQSLFIVCLGIGLANNLFGRNGILRVKGDKEIKSDPTTPD